MRTYSNKVYCRQFVVSRTTTSCSSRTERLQTVHTTLSLTCVPICLSSLNQKTGRQTVRSDTDQLQQVMIDSWAQLSQDTEPSDWSAAKKTDDGYNGKGWSCSISSGLTTYYVRDRPRFIVFRIKFEQNSCVIVKFNAILGYWGFMQIMQRIFNAMTCKLRISI